MNSNEMKNIKESSTNIFTAMAKNLYITGIRIYKEQEEYEVLEAIMLDSNNVYRHGGSYYQPTNNCGCWVCRR